MRGEVNVECIEIGNCSPRRNWAVYRTQSTSEMLAVVREM